MLNTTQKTILLYTLGGLLGLSGMYVYNRYFKTTGKAIRLAKQEWEKWGEQKIDKYNTIVTQGGLEFQDGFSDRVGRYWKEGTGKNYDGRNRGMAWSATFISWLMKKSGAKNRFKYSTSHSTYIRDSILNRKQNLFNKPFVGFRVKEYAPSIGDLVCYSREKNTDLYDADTPYKSHCDLVVKKGKNFIEVIGGNVRQSVSKRTLITDDKGYLIDNNNNWFVILKSNI